jgi:hypothetical protein
MYSDMTEVITDIRDTRRVRVSGGLVADAFLRIGGVVERWAVPFDLEPGTASQR